MPCRATQDRQVMVESSDRMWPTGEGNGKPLQYSCLESSMNSTEKANRFICAIFLELSCFLDDPMDVGNLISGSSAFSQSSLNIWKFTVHVLLKPGLENFEHYFASI